MQLRESLKTIILTAIRDDIDSGGAAGTLVLGTATMAKVCAIFTLNYPCGTVTTDTLTGSGFPKTVNAIDGQPGDYLEEVVIKNSAGVTIISGLTVGIGPDFDINLINTSVVLNQPVEITNFTLLHG